MYQTEEIILAGFGGQGVLSMGQMLSYSAIIENKETTWMPSYGPEMRGGTANCIVIVSDRRVSSPIITRFDTGLILNQPSLDKFEPAIKPGGYIFYEESTIINPPTRTDITCIKIAAIAEAEKMKKKQIANMIMLGAFLEVKPIVAMDSILKALKKVLPERHHHLIPLNEQAITRGKELAAEQLHLTV
jgi:2-oxoglutarate ferredoxin oxidoreductase subunit gamma